MMTNNTVNPPKAPSMATKIARAAGAYAQKANHNGGIYVARHGFGGSAEVGGIGGAAMRAAGVSNGGIAGAAARSLGGAGSYLVSSEAARAMLERNQDKLGALLEARLKSQAGPIKP